MNSTLLQILFRCIIAWAIFIGGTTYSIAQINDWENPAAVSQNTLKPHTHFIPYPSSQAAITKKSPFIFLLDGNWKFHLANNPQNAPKNFFEKSFDVSSWSNIKVPASWQTEGFDKFIFTDVEYPIKPDPPFVPKDYNPVGSYKKNFTIPSNWKGRQVVIHFDAVNSFFYCWINGVKVGFSKDSKTPAEFDITQYLIAGTNTVSVQVYRFSDGTYLEGQDMWKLSGIEGSVYLLARPKTSIYDFTINALLNDDYKNGLFDLSIELQNLQKGNSTELIEVKLTDPNNQLVYSNKRAINNERELRVKHTISNVNPWNAENPALYTLVINHTTKNGSPIESIIKKIGFRSIEIRHGLFLVNGVAVKIKGVNRHEFDMITGKVITVESMINDIRLFKQYNINAVRCSHYPNRVEWYELCDQYGIYIVDEANIECDGMSFHPWQTLSDKPEWKPAYLDRVKRMYERNKNFSSIVTWSLGNESRFGENFIAAYQYLKTKDKTRPIQYEEARDNPYTDIFCPMYKNTAFLMEYVKEWRNRPLILSEYAHMMGNGGGNLKDYWDLIYKYDQLQGGFVWDFADQTFLLKDEKGRKIWGYGRDMGNVGVTSDTSFCADGLFNADRTPKPQAFELKKVYQPIHFESVPFSSNTVLIKNHFDFTTLSSINFLWQIKANGKIVAKGKIDELDIAPHQSNRVSINFPIIDILPNTEYFLELEARTNKDTELIPANYLIAEEQFLLPFRKEMPEQNVSSLFIFSTKVDATNIEVSFDDCSIVFNKKSGWLEQINYKGTAVMKSPLLPDFWRPATDNDIGNSQQIRCAVWKTAAEKAILDSIRIDSSKNGFVEIKTYHSFPSVSARYTVSYKIQPNYSIIVHAKMIAGADSLPEMPRFGMKLLINKSINKVEWLGRGPYDNYQDRYTAAKINLYRMNADSLFFPYARAQESGYRTGLRWMRLQNEKGFGIMATGLPLFSAGVLHFDREKLEFDRYAHKNNHGGSMENDDFIHWNIDYKQMGVGGDNSWGAKAHAEYLLPYRSYEYSFELKILPGEN